MCKFLEISRSTYYYESRNDKVDTELENSIITIFRDSKNNYGTRKIKHELSKKGFIVSRRKIARIMSKYCLVSNYTVASYKVNSSKVNEEKVENHLNREFNNKELNQVIVSDLTYVRVGNKWNYVCILIDLFNREIIGQSVGPNKTAQLVYKAFASIKTRLDNISYFHTDRGSEFKNKLIDQVLETFDIKRSLSKAGCPYDNAVAEATFKTFKTEFINQHSFETINDLEIHLLDYINWFNKKRIHGSLGYLTPVDYKLAMHT